MSLLKSNKLARMIAPKQAVLIPQENRQSISEVLQTNPDKPQTCPSEPVVLKPIVKVLSFSSRPQRYDVTTNNIEMCNKRKRYYVYPKL
jgi:hypothetical protein